MKKRAVLLLVFAALAGGGVFAQTHYISAEVSVLGFGARYEFLLSPYFTVSVHGYFNFMPVPSFWQDPSYDFSWSHDIAGGGVAGRWYPWGQRFFVELGLGYTSWRTISDEYGYYYSDGYSYPYTGEGEHIAGGFFVAPGFGWTIDIGKPGGIFISPGIWLPFVIIKKENELTTSYGAVFSSYDYGGFLPSFGGSGGIQVLLTAVVYCGLGWAF